MGNSGASSKHVDLGDLVGSTLLKEAELRDLLKQFRRAVGASSTSARGVNVLSSKQWRELSSLSSLDSEPLQRIVFRAFDFDGDGSVSFDDAARSLGILTRGSAQDKLTLCVRALEHDESLGKEENVASNGSGNSDKKEGRVCREDLVLALEAVLKLLDTPGATSEPEPLVLEAQGGDTFPSAPSYAAHLFDSLGAREDATELSSAAYSSGAWQSLDVFLATRLSPLTDVED